MGILGSKRTRKRVYEWPQTSDKEFSKRMFIQFMCAFFIQIVLSIIAECFFDAGGITLTLLQTCVPVYTTIFAAVIVKGGVENVFKGQAWANNSDDDDTENG